MLCTHIKQTDIISHTRGDTCNQTLNLHFRTLPYLQHQDKKINWKTISFVPHRYVLVWSGMTLEYIKKRYGWRKADKRIVSCHISVPRKLISTDSISRIIIFTRYFRMERSKTRKLRHKSNFNQVLQKLAKKAAGIFNQICGLSAGLATQSRKNRIAEVSKETEPNTVKCKRIKNECLEILFWKYIEKITKV